jgi:hypothetical protein
MTLTIDQVAALAPDASAASAGRKLGSPAPWRNLGRSERSLWGECQGSAVYQVRIDLSDLTSKCSCPSRKFPCKHALGLLFLSASAPQALTAAAEPEWVSEWLEKRADAAAKKEVRAEAQKEARPPDPQAQEARAERRLERIRQGIEALDLWLGDLVRNGLALVEAQPPSFWEAQAARLVDAQAPGLAARLRRMAGLAGAGSDWPALLLAELGRLALLTHAFRRLDALDPALREDVRRLVGFTLSQEEVAAGADVVTDRWVVLGQTVEEDERVRLQRTWLAGETTGRRALILQFAVGDGGFQALFAPGTRFEGDLAFWPSAWPQRALVKERRGVTETIGALPPLPGTGSIGAFLEETAAALARQPWLDRFPCALRGVVPVPVPDGGKGETFQIRDQNGLALPLVRGDHWKLVALSGGRPLDLAGEWDGAAFLPLGAAAGGAWHRLGRSV